MLCFEFAVFNAIVKKFNVTILICLFLAMYRNKKCSLWRKQDNIAISIMLNLRSYWNLFRKSIKHWNFDLICIYMLNKDFFLNCVYDFFPWNQHNKPPLRNDIAVTPLNVRNGILSAICIRFIKSKTFEQEKLKQNTNHCLTLIIFYELFIKIAVSYTHN